MVDVGALTAFALLYASVIGWFWVRKRAEVPSVLRHVLVPQVGMGIVIAVIVEASGTAQLVGAIWLGVGLVVLAAQWRGRATGGAGGSGGTGGTADPPDGPGGPGAGRARPRRARSGRGPSGRTRREVRETEVGLRDGRAPGAVGGRGYARAHG